MGTRLFPGDLPRLEWVEFGAEGFSAPVSGLIYGADRPPTHGMPLGGIDTGCLDLDATGMLGYMTIFNSLAPRRGPLNLPFLGLKVEGQTHVLATHGMPGVAAPVNISYWGHYPVADVEFELDGPVDVGLRAWSPFIPGDVESSMIPSAVFEVHLRNGSDRPVQGALAMSFPGFEHYESSYRPMFFRRAHTGDWTGGIAISGSSATGEQPEFGGYALGVFDALPVRLGSHFGWDAGAWQKMDEDLVPPMTTDANSSGMSVSVDFALGPQSSEVVRFVLAWYAPVWSGGGTRSAKGNKYTHMYADKFADVEEVAQYLVGNHEPLLQRVLAWQQVLYGQQDLPIWLRDSLVNILHLVTETGVWAQAKEPIGDWCRPEDGLFGMNESPRACPQIECLPCSVLGNLPIAYFFPKLALSTLRGYKAYQFEDGRPTWIFGGITGHEQAKEGQYEMAEPDRGYQQSLNGFNLIELVDKMWRRRADDEVLSEFYDMCKRATIWTMSLRPEYGDKQVISMPTGNVGTEWFEAPEPGWAGMATHLGGLRLTQMLMMKRMAERMDDAWFAQQCERWFQVGSKVMEEHLWAGEYYLNFFEPETGTRSDLVFGYQLDGQWAARFHGTADAFPPHRVETVLATVKRFNVALSRSGAVNYTLPDGSKADPGGYGTHAYFPPALLMLAMTYMYHGQREFGLELARRCWENIACTQRLTWDQPNLFRGDLDTGECWFGNDYYQNMMLWSLPAALEGQDLAGPCKPGGLIDRIIQAGGQA